MSCDACGKSPSDKHHIKTRWSGGTDDDFNLIDLCRQCHVAINQLGAVKFIRNNPHLESLFELKGWEIMNVFGIEKLVREK